MTPEEVARKRFESDTAEHRMEVIRDDGVYRHIRFQRLGTVFYYFDIVTWPGHLAITGDCGSYLFSRLRDMFDFFDHDGYRINAHYWGEKLVAPRGRDSARSYSEDVLRQRLYEWADDEADDDEMYPSLLRGALDREVFTSDEVGFEDGAREILRDLERDGLVGETWEWDLREFDGQFLWCCWAILWGIRTYRTTYPAKQEIAA